MLLMKIARGLGLIFLSFVPGLIAFGQICSGDIILTTQNDIDNFSNSHVCSEIAGKIVVSGEDIVNLNGLSGLQKVDYLEISDNPLLKKLDGLEGLKHVGAGSCLCALPGLAIVNNPALVSITGLSNLLSIDGNLRIESNLTLTNLSGLNGLTTLGQQLAIVNNPALENIDGLGALTSIGVMPLSGQSILISDNTALTTIKSINGIKSLAGEIKIENNSSLVSIEGFSALTNISGGEKCGLVLNNNPKLERINGFSALSVITGGRRNGYLEIRNNDALKNIDGLGALTRIEGGPSAYLEIDGNESLENVNGLSSLVSIRGGSAMLKIIDNPALSVGCGLYPLLHNNGLNGLCGERDCPASIIISGDGPGFTREAILSQGPCMLSVPPVLTLITGNVDPGNDLVFYPNPSHGDLYLEVREKFLGSYYVALTDITGAVVAEKTIYKDSDLMEAQFDLAELSPGMYWMSVSRDDGTIYHKKIVISH